MRKFYEISLCLEFESLKIFMLHMLTRPKLYVPCWLWKGKNVLNLFKRKQCLLFLKGELKHSTIYNSFSLNISLSQKGSCLDCYFLKFLLKIYIYIYTVTIWYIWDKKMIEKYIYKKSKNFSLKNSNPNMVDRHFSSSLIFIDQIWTAWKVFGFLYRFSICQLYELLS